MQRDVAPEDPGPQASGELHQHHPRDLDEIAPDRIQREPTAAQGRAEGADCADSRRMRILVDDHGARHGDALLRQHHMRNARAAIHHAHAMRSVEVPPAFVPGCDRAVRRRRPMIRECDDPVAQWQIAHPQLIEVVGEMLGFGRIEGDDDAEHVGLDLEKLPGFDPRADRMRMIGEHLLHGMQGWHEKSLRLRRRSGGR